MSLNQCHRLRYMVVERFEFQTAGYMTGKYAQVND